MSTAASTRPRPASPQVVVRIEPYNNFREILRLLPASLASAVVHAGFILLIWFFPWATEQKTETVLAAEPAGATFAPPPSKDPFLTTDVNMLSEDFATDINYVGERIEDVSVPGIHLPAEPVGIVGGDLAGVMESLPPPPGIGRIGQGATALDGVLNTGPSIGTVGGMGPRGVPLAGSFYGRSGATREYALKSGGGTTETEAAVTAGLRWILRMQSPDGSWRLDNPRFKDPGSHKNDTAGAAFGLLPLLGAGKTHKPAAVDSQAKMSKNAIEQEKAYSQAVFKGLMYLIRNQDKKDGKFSSNMYAHGLATIAMCEAFGLTQDPNLRKYAQLGVNYILYAQHDGGGWRYAPKQAGDTSVVGWQVMALKSAQMAGLYVDELAMKKAVRFLDSVVDPNSQGYGYTGPGNRPTMTAVGLLCRQYIQSWGPKNPKMQRAIENLKARPPTVRDMYYSYYATQVMHHYGGQEWDEWNLKMREALVKSQDKSKGDMNGSWGGAGSHVSGRLMQTSLCLLTLEVYYRHLPLYYRASDEMARD